MVDIRDDTRTLWVRKEYPEEGLLDATAKRHYNHPVIYEWDERKRVANTEKHGLDFASADLVFESEPKVTNVSGKGGEKCDSSIMPRSKACLSHWFTL